MDGERGRKMIDSNRICLEQFVSKQLYVELCYDRGIKRYVLELYPQTLGMKHLDKEFKFRTKFFAYRMFKKIKDMLKKMEE